MIVAVDLDNTISADPEFYHSEMRGLMKRGHQVHVVSGNPEAEKVLGELGMLKGRDFTRCVRVPKKGIARFKVAYMRHVGATHLIDNSKKNIRAVRRAGFTGHWHASPKAPEEG